MNQCYTGICLLDCHCTYYSDIRHVTVWNLTIYLFILVVAHFLVSTFPGSVSVFLRGYLLRGLGLCPCRSLCFLQPSVFGEALLCVGTVTGILAISWKSNLFIYFQVVTMEQTAAHWHAVAKLVSKSLNILNPTFVLFHITNKLISMGHRLYAVSWILYI